MNTLLISPEFPDTFWSFKHALKFIRKRASFPPLGLLTVAALLPASWKLRLVDLNVQPLSDGDLAWADLALVGAMAVQDRSARNVIARCHDAAVPVVAGGPLFSCEPDAFPDVEHLVLDEAEITLPVFLADLQGGKPRSRYSASAFADLSKTPTPRWDLIDMDRYASMSVQFSRGCPYHCDFCNVTSLFGRRPRTKSAAQVLAELDELWDRGWRGAVFFVDDNLIGHRRKLREELLPALIQRRQAGRCTSFFTEASINLADDPALLEAMVQAGFDTVFVGIESPSDASLAECSKHQNTDRDLAADVRTIQRAGMEVQAGFIVGFDHDTPSIFRRQLEFIQHSGIVTAMVGLLQAPTGTRLYERLRREGRLLGRLSGDNVDGTTNIVPRMGMDALRRGYRDLLGQVYAPKQYYARIRTFLREYRRPARVRTRCQRRLQVRWQHAMAFARSVLYLGVIGRERLQYWRLLVWTLCRRPRSLPMAVSLAIYGYHFRKVCQQHVT